MKKKTGRVRANSAPALPVADVMQFEALARKRLSQMAYDYIRSGGADEITMCENRLGFERLALSPRVLVDVSEIDTRISLLGFELDSPILLAPIAYQRLFHPEGELATARGANAAGAIFVVSTFATTAIREIAKNTSQPIWFQLYAQRDRAFTRAMIERAISDGCKALCLTVDTPVLGCRYGQIKFAPPPGIDCPQLHGLAETLKIASRQTRGSGIYDLLSNPTFTWRDVEWLRSFANVPLLLKGIMNPDDAVRAVDAGVDGIIVSNHGGRNLDMLPPAIEALPSVVDAVGGRIPVLMDSGIRRGTDILMALALGARAVLVGRPYVYGLAAGGAEGVERVIRIFREELERAMALTGRRSIAEIDSSVLWRKQATLASTQSASR
ncbi:MAG TPA: alpha-hydroxy acid oxidase [Candidatus Angelobacter sp.]|nr:alpha-hydroxy acid oxidase [Candidatus Angelobacter sp.]